MIQKKRCSWPQSDLDIDYHDTEWGVPLHEDRRLFELLTLEGAQAGLSWSIVLKKRPTYESLSMTSIRLVSRGSRPLAWSARGAVEAAPRRVRRRSASLAGISEEPARDRPI